MVKCQAGSANTSARAKARGSPDTSAQERQCGHRYGGRVSLELDGRSSAPIILGADEIDLQHDVRILQTAALDHGRNV